MGDGKPNGEDNVKDEGKSMGDEVSSAKEDTILLVNEKNIISVKDEKIHEAETKDTTFDTKSSGKENMAEAEEKVIGDQSTIDSVSLNDNKSDAEREGNKSADSLKKEEVISDLHKCAETTEEKKVSAAAKTDDQSVVDEVSLKSDKILVPEKKEDEFIISAKKDTSPETEHKDAGPLKEEKIPEGDKKDDQSSKPEKQEDKSILDKISSSEEKGPVNLTLGKETLNIENIYPSEEQTGKEPTSDTKSVKEEEILGKEVKVDPMLAETEKTLNIEQREKKDSEKEDVKISAEAEVLVSEKVTEKKEEEKSKPDDTRKVEPISVEDNKPQAVKTIEVSKEDDKKVKTKSGEEVKIPEIEQKEEKSLDIKDKANDTEKKKDQVPVSPTSDSNSSERNQDSSATKQSSDKEIEGKQEISQVSEPLTELKEEMENIGEIKDIEEGKEHKKDTASDSFINDIYTSLGKQNSSQIDEKSSIEKDIDEGSAPETSINNIHTSSGKQASSQIDDELSVEKEETEDTAPDSFINDINPSMGKKSSPEKESEVSEFKSGALQIIVHKAKELVNQDRIGKSDPYVIVKYRDQEFRSKTINNTLEPEWNFTSEFDIVEIDDSPIEIEIYDNDYGKDSSEGSYSLTLDEAINDLVVEGKWYNLEGCKTGKIFISTIYVSKDDEEQDQKKDQTEAEQELQCSVPEKPSIENQKTVSESENLNDKKEISETSLKSEAPGLSAVEEKVGSVLKEISTIAQEITYTQEKEEIADVISQPNDNKIEA